MNASELEIKFYDTVDKINAKLNDIEKKLVSVETKLDNDFREIHGNGQPGLVQKFNDLQTKVSNLETELKAKRGTLLWFLNAIAWFATFALGLFNFFSK